ncbi:DMT family transporter [Corynebacterium amycolatum]|uniref:DMT family transporter n=1 Tax=Corynebacterium amycolatum TaxID=43765 RepID=A0AAW9SX61_CORAY|nr:DMT family transporter [Corynebacterium amycolatum]MDK7238209.1 DMT family transporter [Corynebacterium amycolatum]MDK7248217.1 DMT family transporter [Corynebacterium amycolatum]
MNNDLLAAILALLSALSIAWGTVIRHNLSGTLEEGTSTLRGVAKTLKLPRWWLGSTLAIAGYVFQVAALAFGTLLLVQPLLVMKLMLTLPLAAKVNGRRISRSEMIWSVALTFAVATLVLLGKPTAGSTDIPTYLWGWALAAGGVVTCGLYAAAVQWPNTGTGSGSNTSDSSAIADRSNTSDSPAIADRSSADNSTGSASDTKQRGVLRQNPKALLLGTATGWLYGFVALLSKSVVDTYVNDGLVQLLLSWELWLLVALAVIGVGLQQAAFNAGPLQASLPAMTVVEPIVAFSLGYIVLGERFQAVGVQWGALFIALATMISATIALAARPAEATATSAPSNANTASTSAPSSAKADANTANPDTTSTANTTTDSTDAAAR